MKKLVSGNSGFHLLEMMISAAVLGILMNSYSMLRTYEQVQGRINYADRVTKVEAASRFERFLANTAAVQNTFTGPFVNFQAGNGFQLRNASNQPFDLIDASNPDLTAIIQIREVKSYMDERGLILPHAKNDETFNKWDLLKFIFPSAYAAANVLPPPNWAGMYTLKFMIRYQLKPNSKLPPYWDEKFQYVAGEVTVGVDGGTGEIVESYNESSLVSKRNSCRSLGKVMRFASTGRLECATPQTLCNSQGLPTRVCQNGVAEIALACSNSAPSVACPALGYADPGACVVDSDCPAGVNEFETAYCDAGSCAYFVAGCGNGIPEGNEQCDDGAMLNGADGSTCTDACTIVATAATAVCGNGEVEPGEQCDSNDTNMCDMATCTFADGYEEGDVI